MSRQGRLKRWTRRLVTARNHDASALSYAHLGITYAASVALYALGGWWLDGKLGTLPAFTLVGVALGAVGGFLWIYREVVRVETKAHEKKVEEKADEEGKPDEP